MVQFKDRLTEAIKLNNISKAELARVTGIKKNTISDYTNGKYKPKQEFSYLLAKTLNVNEQWLLGHDVEMLPKEVSRDEEKEILKQEIDDVFAGKPSAISATLVTENSADLAEEDIDKLKELVFNTIMVMRDEREARGEKRY